MVKNNNIWAIVILCAVLFFVSLFITIMTENPLAFIIYIAILTVMLIAYLFMKLRDCMGILLNGGLAIGKVTEHNSNGKGQGFAIVNYTAKDGNTYKESVPTIAFFICPLIYDKRNPYHIIALSDFIWKMLLLLASIVAFGYEIWLILNILTR